MRSIAHGVWSNVLSALSVKGPIMVIIFKVSVIQKTPTGRHIFCSSGTELAKGVIALQESMNALGHIPCGQHPERSISSRTRFIIGDLFLDIVASSATRYALRADHNSSHARTGREFITDFADLSNRLHIRLSPTSRHRIRPYRGTYVGQRYIGVPVLTYSQYQKIGPFQGK